MVVDGVMMICETVDVPGVDKTVGTIGVAEVIGVVVGVAALAAGDGLGSRSTLRLTPNNPSSELVGDGLSGVTVDA